MNKKDFFNELSLKLAALPKSEIEKSILYYDEIINDRMEEGMSEQEAIEVLGSINDIAKNIMYDMSIPALMKAKVNESKSKASNKGLWLTLVIIGSPIWVPLLIAFAAAIFAMYVSVWALIISFYAVVIFLGAAFVSGIIAGIIHCYINLPIGLCAIGAAIFCGTIALFLIQPVFSITKSLIKFTVYILRKIKSLFIAKKGITQ